MPSTTTLRYALDARNRLAVTDLRDTLQPRRVLEGHWKLTDSHELALTLRETGERQRQTIYLKGSIMQAQANALVFTLRQVDNERLHPAQRLTLSGRWQADDKNRLNFLVEKADGSEDRLTLQGGWEVGPHHELRYRYRQQARAGRTHEAHTLIFEGFWDIAESNRLVYRLVGSHDSTFEFTASLRSPSLLAGDGRMVYEVGIGVARGKTERMRVALFGTWKVNRDLSVSFEIPYADGRVRSIRFEAAATLNSRDRIAVSLRNDRHDDVGLTVLFTRKLVGDANLFLRLQKRAEETSVVGGVQVRF